MSGVISPKRCIVCLSPCLVGDHCAQCFADLKPPRPLVVGAKHDTGKSRWSLLPIAAVAEVVKVLDFGARKYSVDNWQLVDDAKRRYTDALWRHFVAWQRGESHDSESGAHHLGHVACNALFLLWFEGVK